MADVEYGMFDKPDETRLFKGHGRVDIVNVGGRVVGRGTFEPGWRWSNDVAPIAGTDLCEVSHLGYCVSGAMTIRMADGTETTLGAGTVAAIPPGHDAWIVGNEPCILLDFGEISTYAKG